MDGLRCPSASTFLEAGTGSKNISTTSLRRGGGGVGGEGGGGEEGWGPLPRRTHEREQLIPVTFSVYGGTARRNEGV